jgi:hypothetical protein
VQELKLVRACGPDFFKKIVFGKKPVSNVTVADQFISKEIFPDEITLLVDPKDPVLNSNSIHILVIAQYFRISLGDIRWTYSNPYLRPPYRTNEACFYH